MRTISRSVFKIIFFLTINICLLGPKLLPARRRYRLFTSTWIGWAITGAAIADRASECSRVFGVLETRLQRYRPSKNDPLDVFDCRYHHTAPISSIYALREALALLANEGLENSWKRHRHCRDRLIAGLAKMNLKPLASDPNACLTCITAIQVPDGVDWKAVTTHAMTM